MTRGEIAAATVLVEIYRPIKRNEKKMRILMVGLDNSGKTMIVLKINGEDTSLISPTLSFNIKTIKYQKCWREVSRTSPASPETSTTRVTAYAGQYSCTSDSDSPPSPEDVLGPYSNLLKPTHPLYNVVLDQYYKAHEFFSSA